MSSSSSGRVSIRRDKTRGNEILRPAVASHFSPCLHPSTPHQPSQPALAYYPSLSIVFIIAACPPSSCCSSDLLPSGEIPERVRNWTRARAPLHHLGPCPHRLSWHTINTRPSTPPSSAFSPAPTSPPLLAPVSLPSCVCSSLFDFDGLRTDPAAGAPRRVIAQASPITRHRPTPYIVPAGVDEAWPRRHRANGYRKQRQGEEAQEGHRPKWPYQQPFEHHWQFARELDVSIVGAHTEEAGEVFYRLSVEHGCEVRLQLLNRRSHFFYYCGSMSLSSEPC